MGKLWRLFSHTLLEAFHNLHPCEYVLLALEREDAPSHPSPSAAGHVEDDGLPEEEDP